VQVTPTHAVALPQTIAQQLASQEGEVQA